MEATILYDESNSVPNIPQEIIFEILSRLPVKSLLKFRCVCKSWLSLISSSQFIKNHLNLSSNSSNMDYSLLLSSFTYPRTLFTCSISSILTNNASFNPVILDFPWKDPIFKVVGTCNGLLCVCTNKESLILCNPTTKKFKKLRVVKEDGVRHVSYGFCFDKLNDDYKVVELSDKLINGSFGYGTKAMVYTLRDDNWREIEFFPGVCVSDDAGICVCGILHWCGFSSSYDAQFILSLDIGTCVYGIMELPKYDESADDGVDWTLGEFGGCLGVICDYAGVRVDIWVMKEYGVKESWITLVSIHYPVYPNSVISPVFVYGNGEVLLNYDPHVMLYNSRNSSLRNLELRDSTGCLLLVASLPYIESLVPLGLESRWIESGFLSSGFGVDLFADN